ncbi:MAG: tRNA lysidine(34) synthetase TilS [Flavobacteriaceae bacterium]|nr:tRNA lysidine(34) synthetase TilS [Flavobacteriaceae bacterium]
MDDNLKTVLLHKIGINLNNLPVEFQKHLYQKFPDLRDRKILLAASGGLDSTVLGHLLHMLKLNFEVAHVNFGLRSSDSDEDERFVKSLASDWNTPFHSIYFDTGPFAMEKGISVQMAARDLRYEWFSKTCEENDIDFVFTAHHADDNLETFLIHFLRGSGLDGLCGIPERNGNIIRPLLPFSKNELEIFAKENSLSWREDASNAETKYKRNKIRHQIIPLLKEINPAVLNTFQSTISHLKQSRDLVNTHIKEIIPVIKKNDLPKEVQYDITKIMALENPKAYLYEFFKDYDFTDWDSVYDLLFAQTGKKVLSKSHYLLSNRGFLCLGKNEERADNHYFINADTDEVLFDGYRLCFKKTHDGYPESEIEVIESNSDLNAIFADADKLAYPLVLRHWKKGIIFILWV